MTRLIDADAAKIRLAHEALNGMPKSLFRVMDVIDETPTVDAVPVIRCRDCKHCRVYCRVWNGIRTDYACDILDEHYDPSGKKRVALDDYCRWAEPKEQTMTEYKTYMVPMTEEEAEQNKGAELLIRCKDCKYQPNSKRRYADNDPIAFYGHCPYMKPYDFCSFARPRE